MNWSKGFTRLGFVLLALALAFLVATSVSYAPKLYLGAVGAYATVFLVTLVFRKWRSGIIRNAAFVWFNSKGKDVLLVHSNSPHWQSYIASEWIPRLGSRVVLLNWSERQQWDREPPEVVALFRRHAGSYNFNPMAIVLQNSGKVEVIRFWTAFRDHRHGKSAPLREAESKLFAALGMQPREQST